MHELEPEHRAPYDAAAEAIHHSMNDADTAGLLPTHVADNEPPQPPEESITVETPDGDQLTSLFKQLALTRNRMFSHVMGGDNRGASATNSDDGPPRWPGVTDAQQLTHIRSELDVPILHDIMDSAGLRLLPESLVPTAEIVDGARFTATLQRIHQPTTSLVRGVEDTIYHSLRNIVNAYVPQVWDPAYETFHIGTPLRSDLTPDSSAYQRYHTAITQTVVHSQALADILGNWHVSEATRTLLHSVREAHDEQRLAAWAVAQHWNLYHPPTTRDEDLEWTQWTTYEDWQKLFSFFDVIITTQEPPSPFTSRLAQTLAANIERRRRGILVPSAGQASSSHNMHQIAHTAENRSPLNDPHYDHLLAQAGHRLINIGKFYATR